MRLLDRSKLQNCDSALRHPLHASGRSTGSLEAYNHKRHRFLLSSPIPHSRSIVPLSAPRLGCRGRASPDPALPDWRVSRREFAFWCTQRDAATRSESCDKVLADG
jgi:hypothetical protein